MNTVNYRIREIRKMFCGDSNKELAEKLKKEPNTVNNYIREGYPVGKGVIADIAEAFPDVDKSWLLTGEGEMLNTGIIQTNNTGDNVIADTVTSSDNALTEKFISLLQKKDEQIDRLIGLLERK